jgi:hypothetical protein
LPPDLLFCYAKFLVPGHIRSSPDISDLRPDISDPTVLTV